MEKKFEVFEKDNEIHINPYPDYKIEEKEQKFILEVENIQSGLKTIFTDQSSKEFKYYLEKLLSLAQLGLVSNNQHLELSIAGINELKNEIVKNHSSDVKNKYLQELGVKIAYYFIPFLLIYIITQSIYVFWYKDIIILRATSFSILLCSSLFGLWLSSTLSKTKLSFDNLSTITSNELTHNLKIILTCILTFTFGALFLKKVLYFEFGGINTKMIFEDDYVAFIFGIVLGLNEGIIGNSLIEKTKQTLKF